MDKKYINLEAIVKDITEGKIEVTGDPYAQKCVEAYRDVVLKRLAAEPAVNIITLKAVYEAGRQDALEMDQASFERHVTDSLTEQLFEALRPHIIIVSEPDLKQGKTIFRAIIQAVRPGA